MAENNAIRSPLLQSGWSMAYRSWASVLFCCMHPIVWTNFVLLIVLVELMRLPSFSLSLSLAIRHNTRLPNTSPLFNAPLSSVFDRCTENMAMSHRDIGCWFPYDTRDHQIIILLPRSLLHCCLTLLCVPFNFRFGDDARVATADDDDENGCHDDVYSHGHIQRWRTTGVIGVTQ